MSLPPSAAPARLDFSRRSTATELMDTEACDFETFRACLADLAQVNVLTLAHGPTLAFLERLRRAGRLPSDRPLRIVDVGSGYGDLLRAIDRWAARRKLSVELTGVDLNPWSAKAAAGVAPAGRPIRWATSNIFDYDDSPDLVVSSLFTHHLSDAELVQFLRWMEAAATLGWFVNDLHRHPLPYHLFKTAAKLLNRHRFVQHDGPVSISRAFTAKDWAALLRSADIDPAAADIRWRFPFRLCVARIKR